MFHHYHLLTRVCKHYRGCLCLLQMRVSLILFVSDVGDKTLGSVGTVNSFRLLYSKYSSHLLGGREYLEKDGTNKRERERERGWVMIIASNENKWGILRWSCLVSPYRWLYKKNLQCSTKCCFPPLSLWGMLWLSDSQV